MGVVYYLMERLRQLMGSNWDYCVLWKLNEDPWLLECVDCCCGGTYQSSQNNEEELAFPVSSTSTPCKDVMFQHLRTTSCELLSQLPPSLPLDGINAEVLISNQPRWLNNANMSDLSPTPEEIIETKVLIPIPGGLVEFYASKMVPEDQGLVDFVVSQCSALLEQEAITNKINQLHPNTSLPNNQTEFPPFSPSTGLANLNLSCADATADRIRICNSAMNFLQQFSYLTETRSNKDDLLLDGSNDHPNRPFQPDLIQQQLDGLEGSMENNDNPLGNGNDHHFNQQQNEEQEKGPMKHELGRPDSGSDSDPIDDEDDSKYTRRRNGKGNQSKNLLAERKRRKKLNERLYTLRSLVPKISKLDRAAILGDAIEYVMELQQQEKDLQNELEQNSDDEDFSSSIITNASQQQNSNIPMEYSNLIGVNNNNLVGVDSYGNGEPSNGFYMGSSSKCQGENNIKRSHDNKTNDKGQQMEVQVEVAHLEGNEFFIKVFGEQRRGGFVRLMEALDSLGLEITTVNVTSCISLVSYVFTVEKKDSEIVQAEYLRESLLEMTRNQSGEWTEMAKAQQGGGGTSHQHVEQYQQQYFHHHQISPHNNLFHQFQ